MSSKIPRSKKAVMPEALVGSAPAAGRAERSPSGPLFLVVIASYGNQNDHYLQRVLSEFRAMDLRLDLHVVTDVAKDLGSDVTVHAGLPTQNPMSLPFAHRQVFAEHLDTADYFLYCEDDTLITEKSIRAFAEVNRAMAPDEIAGFLRLEQVSEEECYMVGAHGPYRWDVESLVRRESLLFASFTNCHSALTLASREQVQRAIESGGFLVAPHVGRTGMLECGASDIYTQCGLNRLICISRIEDFLVAHLSNKNNVRWGLRYEEFVEQTQALQRVESTQAWRGSLLEVETSMTRARWSKNLYERPDPSLVSRIPEQAKTILSVGSGWGVTEELLANHGKQVTGIPVDAVFADCLRRRGIEAVEGPLEEVVNRLGSRRFDAVLLLDVLHLTSDPARWLTLLKPLIGPNGLCLATTPRTFDPLRMIWYLRGEPATAFPRDYAESHVQRVNRARLRKWFKAAEMEAQIIENRTTPKRLLIEEKTAGVCSRLATNAFIVLAKPKAAS